MEVNEQAQKRGIENDIEAPSPNPGTARSGEVEVQHKPQNDEAGVKLQDLALRKGLLPLGTHPQCAR